MGISVDITNYDLNRLWEDFKKTINIEGTQKEHDKFIYVLKLHGIISGDRYFILNNEWYDEGNYYYAVSTNLAKAFGLTKFSGFLREDDEDYDEDEEDDDDDADIFSKVFLSSFDGHKDYYSADISTDSIDEVEEKIKEYVDKESNE